MLRILNVAIFINEKKKQTINNFNSQLLHSWKGKEAGIYTGGLRRCYDRSRPSDNFFSLSENKPCLTPPPPPGIAVHPTTSKHTQTIVTSAQQDVVTLR